MSYHSKPKQSGSKQPRQTNNPLLEEARRLRLKKRFSQHFLVNANVLDRIAGLMQLQPSETVLEIGPGSGFLTERLLATGAHVEAVELERRMCAYLREKFAKSPNFTLHESDILRFDFDSVQSGQNNLTNPENTDTEHTENRQSRLKIVGNLPYAITSKIMFLLAGELDAVDYPLRNRIAQLTVMVQKEVGERIAAKPGTKAYNALSIALQVWFEPRYDLTVPASDFCPPPKVESAVVTLIPRPAPLVPPERLPMFSRIVRTAFAQKRKTLRNTLLNGNLADAAVLDTLFQKTGINPSLRAEQLTIGDFDRLADAFGADARENQPVPEHSPPSA